MSDNFELTLGGEKAAAAEEITLTLGDAPATPAPAVDDEDQSNEQSKVA